MRRGGQIGQGLRYLVSNADLLPKVGGLCASSAGPAFLIESSEVEPKHTQ